MTPSLSSRLDWMLFVLLGFLWGSSFLFIKIGVEAGLQPLTLVMLRLLFGFVLLAVVVAAARQRLPSDPRAYAHLAVVGVLSNALPFSLISWAEQRVDSTLAAVLNAAVPLFVVPIAALALPGEGVTGNRLAGVAVGIVGVAIVVGFEPLDVAAGGDFVAELALIAATVSYAAGNVYAKRNVHGLRPMTAAQIQIAFALLIATVLAFSLEWPPGVSLRPEALLAVVWLGFLGTGTAFVVYFRLLGRWGATRTSLVAYLLPIYGVALGAAVLREPVDARLLLGTALIIGGIACVNWRPAKRLVPRLPRRSGKVRRAGPSPAATRPDARLDTCFPHHGPLDAPPP